MMDQTAANVYCFGEVAAAVDGPRMASLALFDAAGDHKARQTSSALGYAAAAKAVVVEAAAEAEAVEGAFGEVEEADDSYFGPCWAWALEPAVAAVEAEAGRKRPLGDC